ncbi:ABC transporter permease [Alkalihalobacterium sp. APHAB7]|uniref:ABC transporter permease n=1 Tax=Alkalihalobacterium sp. APHAB7 TaxID=3402081 RepID=UPI003AAC23B8
MSESELMGSSQVVMINEDVQTELFPDKTPIGEFIGVKGMPFRVVGIFTDKSDGSIFYGDWRNQKSFSHVVYGRF